MCAVKSSQAAKEGMVVEAPVGVEVEMRAENIG